VTIDRFASPWSLWTPLVGILLFITGCNGQNHVPPAVADSNTAKSALETALEAWKQGSSTRDLAEKTPPIVVADEDWQANAKLIDFQLMPGEETTGVSIRWPVRLTLSSGAGRKTIDAVYVIATSPAIHIARAD
jgi:hypothetical protein